MPIYAGDVCYIATGTGKGHISVDIDLTGGIGNDERALVFYIYFDHCHTF